MIPGKESKNKHTQKLSRLIMCHGTFSLCLPHFVLVSWRSQHMSQFLFWRLQQNIHIYIFLFNVLITILCPFSLLSIFTLRCIFIFMHNFLAKIFLTFNCNNMPMFTELSKKRSRAVRVSLCYWTHSITSTKITLI